MTNPCLSWQELILQQGEDWVRQQNMRMLSGPGLFLEPAGHQAQPPSQDQGRPGLYIDEVYRGMPVDIDAHLDIAREMGWEDELVPMTNPAPAQIRAIADIVAWFAAADDDLRQRCLAELKPYLPKPQQQPQGAL